VASVDNKPELQYFEEAQQLQAQGFLDLAALNYQMALEFAPEFSDAAYALGCLQQESHDYSQAIISFKRVLDHNPVFAPAYFQLGRIYQSYFGAFQEALFYYQKATQLDIRYTEAYYHAGFLQRELNQPMPAIQSFLKYIQFHPERADIFIVLGDLFLSVQALDKAAQYYFKALELEPENVYAMRQWLQIKAGDKPEQTIAFLTSLATSYPELRHMIAARVGILMEREYQFEEAQKCYQMALEDPSLPDRLAWELKQALLLPLFPASVQEQERVLHNLQTNLAQYSLLTDLPEAGIAADYHNAEAYFSNWFPLHHLAYTHVEALVPRQQLARLMRRLLPPLPPAPEPRYPHRERRRVGFVLGVAHTALWGLYALIQALPSEQFELQIIFTDFLAADSFRSQPLAAGFEVTVLSEQIPEALGQMQALELDILCLSEPHIYQPIQVLLASYRFAPVQFTSWLSLGTTGQPEMDYFLSSVALETPENPQRFYSERLILNSGLPAFYRRPAQIALWPRSDYGLPEQGALYLCPHLLHKFSPDFDALLAGILQKDPEAQIVLLTHPNSEAARLALIQRFEQTLSEFMPRIWFLPYLKYDEYLNLLSLGDVMLDTRPCGGGVMVYEALSAGLPVITWPTEQAHGRIAQACLHKIGLADCIASSAEEYIQKAVNMATDRDFNQSIRTEIRQRVSVLFEDPQSVADLSAFLLQVEIA
jgi:protein O-GlcNAc transferase